MIVKSRNNFKKMNFFVKSRWSNILQWTHWSRNWRKSMDYFFMNKTTLTKISNSIFIKIYRFTSFNTNSSRNENFEKKNKCVDRMYFLDVKIDEMIYLRLLLVNGMSCTSFENLKTMFVQIENAKKNQIEIRLLDIYKNACRVLELIDNNDEWHIVITKTIEFNTTVMLENLIMIIFLKFAFVESVELWKNHKIA